MGRRAWGGGHGEESMGRRTSGRRTWGGGPGEKGMGRRAWGGSAPTPSSSSGGTHLCAVDHGEDTCTSVCEYMYIHVHVYVHVCTHVHVSAHPVLTDTSVCTYIHVHVHVYMYSTNINTHRVSGFPFAILLFPLVIVEIITL